MRKTSITNRIIWILAAFFIWYILIGEIAVLEFDNLLTYNIPMSNEVFFVVDMYTCILASVIVYLLFCLLPKNRPLLESVIPTKEKKSFKLLGIGILLGFLTNFFCIACALIHKDIFLYFDFSLSQIPFLIFAFISVMFQSASEELWCRGMLYERINVHYPVWVSVLVNGTLFGLLHAFNPGITPFALASLVLCGLSYSLLRWYSGSIWTCIGIHTMWNFTQNILFGLPNSGLVSEASVFHLDAATGTSNLIYDHAFGVEGAVPALLMDAGLAIVILILAKKNNRLGELCLSQEKIAEQKKAEDIYIAPEGEY